MAETFAQQVSSGQEVGAALSVYHRGKQVVDLWGGLADVQRSRSWEKDTRVVIFSATKGLAAMAMHLLAAREVFAWDDPIARHWPGFGMRGKADITIRQMFNHCAGLPWIDRRLSLRDCTDPKKAEQLCQALQEQVPAWPAGERQAYHPITLGLYASELFRRLAGESMSRFLERELFHPLQSDARLRSGSELDSLQATLYAPSPAERGRHMASLALREPQSPEARMLRQLLKRSSVPRKAFGNPRTGRRGVLAYSDQHVRRGEVSWGGATSSADGLARAYLPFSLGGQFEGSRYFPADSLRPLFRRQSWSSCDATLQKPLGWSQGFLKEQRHLFSPQPESFGHAGMGGALGWCDPVNELALGYVMNRMDWRIRSPRPIGLCRALYECDPLCEPQVPPSTRGW